MNEGGPIPRSRGRAHRRGRRAVAGTDAGEDRQRLRRVVRLGPACLLRPRHLWSRLRQSASDHRVHAAADPRPRVLGRRRRGRQRCPRRERRGSGGGVAHVLLRGLSGMSGWHDEHLRDGRLPRSHQRRWWDGAVHGGRGVDGSCASRRCRPEDGRLGRADGGRLARRHEVRPASRRLRGNSGSRSDRHRVVAGLEIARDRRRGDLRAQRESSADRRRVGGARGDSGGRFAP